MLCPVIWRCARHLVVFLPVALFTGHAAGQSPRCLDPSAAPAPAFAAEQAQAPPHARHPDLENDHNRRLERRQCNP